MADQKIKAMSLKLASFGYCPPRGTFCADAFMQNLRDHKPKHEQILYSDDDWGIEGMIKLRASPEIFKDATFSEGPQKGKPNPFAMHNSLFLAGLKMCRERGVSHAIYLEQDCRVGVEGWDDIVFDEFFSLGRPCIVAGTIAVYNPSNNGLDCAKRFQRLFADPPRHGIPTGIYGWMPAAQSQPPTVFPNGALAVYDVAWLCSMFDVDNQGGMATNNTAFDQAVGSKLWELFGMDALEVMGSLGSIYSGYGDCLTTVEQRRELLSAGKVVAIHQIKDEWVP